MCESKIILEGEDRLILDEVTYLSIGDGEIRVVTLDGREEVLTGYRVSSIDFIKHEIYVERI